MKILLAGATSVVGLLLLPMLVQAGHEVLGTTRSSAKSNQITESGGLSVVIDVMDHAATFAVLEQVRPDVVIHQLTDLGKCDCAANSQLRLEGIPNLVDAARAALLALDWPMGAYNIVDDEPATKKELFGLYASIISAPPPPYKSGKEAWERGESNIKAHQMSCSLCIPHSVKGSKPNSCKKS